jgi:hypothetical protein
MATPPLRLRFLALIKALNDRIIPHREIGRFDKRPGYIRVAILGLALAFAFAIAELGAVHATDKWVGSLLCSAILMSSLMWFLPGGYVPSSRLRIATGGVFLSPLMSVRMSGREQWRMSRSPSASWSHRGHSASFYPPLSASDNP